MKDLAELRANFPILKSVVNGHALVYLDSAATTQKPELVIRAINDYYRQDNANINRGAHALGAQATEAYEKARSVVADFIGARVGEIVFTRNTTEAINLVAYSWGADNIQTGDVVLTTEMEHHSNIVPWQALCQRVGAKLQFIKVTEQGELDLDDYKRKLNDKPKLVVFAHISNVTGVVNPVRELTKLAHRKGAKVLIDGAQAVGHMPVDMREIGCDFYAFSGHKMYGPMGIGVLWGRREILAYMRPFLTGGGMIDEVNYDDSTYQEPPAKFEAGTPNVEGAVGLGVAIEFINEVGINEIAEYERDLLEYAHTRLSDIPQIRILGAQKGARKARNLSFVYDGVHAHDVATILDQQGVAVRSGHHCAMILHKKMGIAASTRVSLGIYNNKREIDVLIDAFSQVKKIFGS